LKEFRKKRLRRAAGEVLNDGTAAGRVHADATSRGAVVAALQEGALLAAERCGARGRGRWWGGGRRLGRGGSERLGALLGGVLPLAAAASEATGDVAGLAACGGTEAASLQDGALAAGHGGGAAAAGGGRSGGSGRGHSIALSVNPGPVGAAAVAPVALSLRAGNTGARQRAEAATREDGALSAVVRKRA